MESMKSSPRPLRDVYRALYRHFGPQYWWPGKTRLEVCVGAILTQGTAWTNVQMAISRLKQEGALSLAGLRQTRTPTLASWIRPAGYYNQKAHKLKAFVKMVDREAGGSLVRLFRLETGRLRRTLLEVKGIGPETADSMLLYAADRPVFVVDAYTRRMLERHHWLASSSTYDEAAFLFHFALPAEVSVFNEYHALLVALGKAYCRPTPRCEACPLRPWLPGKKKAELAKPSTTGESGVRKRCG